MTAGDYGTVLQSSSLAQQQQQQVSSEEKNDVLDNTERNTVQEPQNEMATGVDLQSEVEKPEDKVLYVTGTYVCTLRTVSSVFCLLLTLQSVCTSVDSYGSGSQTSRLPSVPEEEENQQHQYDHDNNNIFSKQVSTIGYFMITFEINLLQQLENEAKEESQIGITEPYESVVPYIVTGAYECTI